MPIFVVGNGSNLLVKTIGIKGCALNLKTVDFQDVKIDGIFAEVGAGLDAAMLLRILSGKGLGGLEFLAGVPATVGGAVAGAFTPQRSAIGPDGEAPHVP